MITTVDLSVDNSGGSLPLAMSSVRTAIHHHFGDLLLTREDKGVRELIPHTGPIPILIPLKLSLDLLRDLVSP